MSGLFSAGGLISGLDSNTLISQLMQIERQPIFRFESRIEALEDEQQAVRDIRTTLTNLRNRAQDFRLSQIFDAFTTASSEETVLNSEVSAPNPVVGAFEIDVTQLASSTVAQSSGVLGAAINSSAALDSSGITTEVTAGTFSINGVAFTVDPTTDSLDDILADINGSAAGVTATYNAVDDTVTIENTAASDTGVINFGATDDDSNFLTVLSVTQATQSTNGSGSTEATSTRHLGAIDATAILDDQSFAGGAFTAGTFSINGIELSIDPSTDTIIDVVERINGSDADVTASYDASADAIRVVANTLGSRTVNFGSAGDTSNFLTITNLDTAVQTAGNDSQFTVNGGAVQTRNTNNVSDAISGVTINLLSVGASTVTVSSDDDAIVASVQEFIASYNDSVNQLSTFLSAEGDLHGDGTLRSIESFVRSNIFNQVTGIAGDFSSLVELGITTGDDFDSSSVANLHLDEDIFREALRDDRTNVEQLFSNPDSTGIADKFYEYLNEATKATGYLNERAKANGSIDQQIESLNDQIDRMEDRLVQRETRLRRQFLQLEQLTATYQNQASALSGLGAGF